MKRLNKVIINKIEKKCLIPKRYDFFDKALIILWGKL